GSRLVASGPSPRAPPGRGASEPPRLALSPPGRGPWSRGDGRRGGRGGSPDPPWSCVGTVEAHHDVLVLGAGLSGIFLPDYHLRRLGTKRFAVLDRRADVGGMWAELRFPGLRTDSPLGLYGYSFHASSRTTRMMPTREELLEYFREVVDEHGLDQYMRFGQHVQRAEFDSQSGRWQLTTSGGRRFSCQHVMNCTGYFDLFDPYIPEIPGMAIFSGRIVHTHSWTDDVEYEGKRVVLVGSGATAVTTAPALARGAKSLTMLQRSPTYIRSSALHYPRWSFWTIATRLVQAGGILKILGRCMFRAIFWWMRRKALWETKAFNDRQLAWSASLPEAVAARERDGAAAVEAIARRFPELRRHFTPEYPLFEQRTGFAPGDEFFSALQRGRLRVITAHIDRFTPGGVRLKPLSSGARAAAESCGEPETPEHLEADLVVLATGHKLSLLGGVELVVDGRPQLLGEKMAYRGGLMVSDVPNMFHFSGYFKGRTPSAWRRRCRWCCASCASCARRGLRRWCPGGAAARETWTRARRLASSPPLRGTRTLAGGALATRGGTRPSGAGQAWGPTRRGGGAGTTMRTGWTAGRPASRTACSSTRPGRRPLPVIWRGGRAGTTCVLRLKCNPLGSRPDRQPPSVGGAWRAG
ncbi:unnamed protein product, partial [Prorocentrum cordatum]